MGECEKCAHKPVCDKFLATGGVKKCEHFKEERKGKWIGIGGNRYTRISQCSNCCAKYDFMSNYCPHCGADMRGEGDGNHLL